MKTTSRVIGSVIAVGVLFAGSATGVAQSGDAERRAELRAAFGEGLLCPEPVLGAPFSAEAVTVWQPPAGSGLREWRATARYYRDGAGRVRVEQMYVGHAGDWRPERVVVVPDPNSMFGYLLDPAAGTASRITRGTMLMTVGGANSLVMPISMTRYVDFVQPRRHEFNDRSHGVHQAEPLGEAVVAGLRVVGTRLTETWIMGATPPEIRTVQEQWVSPELKVMVYSRPEDSAIGVVEYRLADIRRVEQPAALFAVPAESVETRLTSTWTWENPYILVQQRPGTPGPGPTQRR